MSTTPKRYDVNLLGGLHEPEVLESGLGEYMLASDFDAAISARDNDWVLAMARGLGTDSGFNVPIVPDPDAFKELFESVRQRREETVAMCDQLRQELEAARAENKVLREQNFSMNKTTVEQAKEIERLTQALKNIQDWANAYPLSVFPEPDFVKVRVALEAAGISLDSVSASNMRHVLNGIRDIISALSPTESEEVKRVNKLCPKCNQDPEQVGRGDGCKEPRCPVSVDFWDYQKPSHTAGDVIIYRGLPHKVIDCEHVGQGRKLAAMKTKGEVK